MKSKNEKDVPLFPEEFVRDYGPGLFRKPEVEAAIDRAIAVMMKVFPQANIEAKVDDKSLRERLTYLGDRYWHDKKTASFQDTYRGRAKEREKLKDASQALNSLITGMSRENKWWLSGGPRSQFLDELKKKIEEFGAKIEELERLDAKRYANKQTKGRKPHVHLDKAVPRAAAIWSILDGKPIRKNFDTAGTPPEFVKDGPVFIYGILSAIDPSLSVDQLKSALKKNLFDKAPSVKK